MNRGDRREPIFLDDADRRRFIETLGEVCAKTGWQVHAYVLMPNHFHLVVETPQPNLVAGMKWLLGVYAKRVPRLFQRGHVDHEAVAHIILNQPLVCLVDRLDRHHLDVADDLVRGAEVYHLLGFRDAADD